MTSRRGLIAAALVAVTAGAGLSLWRQRAAETPPADPANPAANPAANPGSGPATGPGSPAATAPTSAAIEQLFAMSLTDPAGQPLSLSQFRNKRLVVNFWATWCPPCVEEMPELSDMAEEFAPKDVQFVGIAIDQAANVDKFLQKVPVQYTIAVAGSAGLGILSVLGNLQGGLPYTLVLDADGSVRERFLGKVEMDALRQVLTS